MKFFAFENQDERLDLLPLSARRALDAAGKKLSLEAFRSLDYQERMALCLEGEKEQPDTDAIRALVALARIPAEDIEPPQLPIPDEVPAILKSQFNESREVHPKLWSTLSELERYALWKVCQKPREPRLTHAFEEIIGAQQISTHLRAQGGVHMVPVTKKEA
ncbi:MAG: hypothetical protein MK135_17550, partial [Polyangiaceae bacterium]|nr:hypothetical protein [Polyangiaceae bacterium]